MDFAAVCVDRKPVLANICLARELFAFGELGFGSRGSCLWRINVRLKARFYVPVWVRHTCGIVGPCRSQQKDANSDQRKCSNTVLCSSCGNLHEHTTIRQRRASSLPEASSNKWLSSNDL